MLFDLRGRRRRVVQVTYLMLALLMGGGLVLFGVGGSVSGGLLDAFKGGGGGTSADSALQDRVDKQEDRLATNPQNAALLQNLVRDYYALATSQRDSGTSGSRTTQRTSCGRPTSIGSATWWPRRAIQARLPRASRSSSTARPP